MSNKITLLIVLFAYCHAFAATSTLTFTAKCNGSGTADDGVVWTVSSDGTESTYNSDKGIQYKNMTGKNISYLSITTNDIPGTITQVKVNACGSQSSYACIQVSVGGTMFYWGNYTQASLITSPNDFIFTGSASGDIRVHLAQNPSQNSLYCKSIEVTYTADMMVHDTETQTISSPQTVENLTIEAGGAVVLSDKKLTVNGDFVLHTTMGSGKSGQLTGATSTNFEVNGDAFIDITLGDNGNPAKWHAFTVPFPVDALHGIYDTDGTPLTNEVHYAIMDYHGDMRANGEYGWKKFTGTMSPGTFYLMTVDGSRTTYRMKAAGELLTAASKPFEYYTGSGATTDYGWNGIGNPTLGYHKVDYPVQVLDPEHYVFETKPANSCNFVVGTPFFYQASADGSMSMLTADAAAAYAPQRMNTAQQPQAAITFGNDDYTDCLYLSASEDAGEFYEIGKDLEKMTMTTHPTVPQIAGLAYGTSLCMLHAPLSDDEASYSLSLYAPTDGTYTIAAQDISEAKVYLTEDGIVLQDITSQAAQLQLTQGPNNRYGIVLSVRSSSPTHMDETGSSEKAARKMLLRNQLWILRGGKLYDSTGKIVRQ